jgi:hypothetical protein
MKQIKVSLVIALVILSGCANLISNFDQNSYSSAMMLKADSIRLVSSGTDNPALHEAEIRELQSKLSAQLAYEQGKGRANAVSFKQWELLASPNKDLLGGFLKGWIEGQTFSRMYVDEKTIQIGIAFDEILKLEAAKGK